jgi:hypothetical protein
MAINIDVHHVTVPPVAGAAAPAGAAATENILDTGNVQYVIQDINNRAAATTQQKIEAYIDCLAQILSSTGKHQGKCESLLKNTLFAYISFNARDAQSAIRNPQFNADPKLSNIIKKVDYLSAGILGYHNSTCNYVRKFGHHFSETFFENKHSGVAYLALGAGLVLIGGLQTVFTTNTSNPTDDKKKNEGWGVVAFGACALAAPVVRVFYSAAKSEP